MSDPETTQPAQHSLEKIDQLFSSAEFSRSYLGLQRAERLKDRLSGELYQHYQSVYTSGGGWSEDDAEQHIDYMMSSIDDTDSEEYDYDEDAARLKKLIRAIDDKGEQVQEHIVDLGKSIDIGQFAIYGLKRYLPNFTANQSVLRMVVENAHRDLESFDEVIRAHEGELVTVINLGIYACRLGSGGITVNDHGSIRLPVAEGTKSFGTPLTDWVSDKIEEWDVNIDAYSLVSDVNTRPDKTAMIFDSWDSLRGITTAINQPGGVTVAFGDASVEGEPIIPAELSFKNELFYRVTFDKVRAVGLAAMNGCLPNPD
ncbi:hypothetical protein HGB25_00675 [Candidatus Saccharibacteria bacterium]|nr:hypothetical protein [Candidatus Saccharibacteria bacterium]